MPTEGAALPVAARRAFRLALTVALALAVAYGVALPMPFIAPVFAFVLTLQPGPPMALKGLVGLVVLIFVTLGIGLLLIPVLQNYPLTGVLTVALGLYACSYLTVNMGKGLVAAFLTAGITLIPVAGTMDFGIALAVIQALALGVVVAILCQWVVYPLFPEEQVIAKPAAVVPEAQSNWIALRAALVVLPPFLLALTNPSLYIPVIMKSVSLGQQASLVDARAAGRELMASTFLGGCFAVLFWFALKLHPNLWMFFLWMLLFGIYFAMKLYQLVASRFSPAVWQNTVVTLFILLGPAVEDSANGDDVYTRFAVRMGLFVAVSVYAWFAVRMLELLRDRRRQALLLR